MMKKLFLFSFFAFLSLAFYAKEIPQNIAQKVAKNFLYEQTGVSQNQIKMTSEVISEKNNSYIYVFNVNGGGFVLVAADDLYKPIIAYSLKNNFKTKNMPDNIAWLISLYEKDIQYVEKNNIAAPKANLWQYYNKDYADFTPTKAPATEVVLETALWDQVQGYNTFCPPADGPGGHAYTGCVATAMAIIMKYWEYPLLGNGYHSYVDSGTTLSANFGETSYMWEEMPTTGPSLAVAKLMYHAGVSVDMNYGGNSAGGSGAHSWDVPNALQNYFRYDQSINYVSKSSYSNTDWFNLIKNEIDNGRITYYSGFEDQGGHAFVCDGYNTDNELHFNFGWSGYDNGFYDVNGSSFEFNQYQAAVINIMPGDDAYAFDTTLSEVTTVNVELDTNNIPQYRNIIEWQAPSSTKALTGYNLYRDDSLLQSDIASNVNSATDEPSIIADYRYSVRPVYTGGIGKGAYDVSKALFQVKFRVYDTANNRVHLATVIFNDDTAQSGFGTAYFYNVAFGGPYSYTVTKDGLPTTTGTVDFVYKDMTVVVIMGQSQSVDEISKPILIYPNPSNDFVHIKGLSANSKISIYDVNGRFISSVNNPTDNETINMANFNNGIYFFKIKTENHTFTQKIVLRK